MNKFTRFFPLFLLFGLVTPAAAMLCPNNFNSVIVGDSMDDVQKKCGAPTETKTSESNTAIKKVTQEWHYYVQLDPTQPGNVKLDIAFKDDKVISMTMNNLGLSQTTVCKNQMIQYGDSSDKVEAACGKPSMVNMNQEEAAKAKATKVTTLIYSTGQFGPKASFTFEDGKLVGK